MENTYHIKVEVIGKEDENGKIDQGLKDGIECNGFVILGNREDDSTSVIHHLSLIDMAFLILKEEKFMQASIIAKAMEEAKDWGRKSSSNLLELLKNL